MPFCGVHNVLTQCDERHYCAIFQSYKEVIAEDNDIQALVKQLKDVVEQNASECKVSEHQTCF